MMQTNIFVQSPISKDSVCGTLKKQRQ